MSPSDTAPPRPQASPALYIGFTVTAALVAAAAAQSAALMTVPPWIMFMGWVAYFTRRPAPAEASRTFVCVVLGLCLGAAATLALGALSPVLGAFAVTPIVLVVALVAISTRGLPSLNNLLGYFIGLITFFAAHRDPTPMVIAVLAGSVALGFVAAFVAQTVEAAVRRALGRPVVGGH